MKSKLWHLAAIFCCGFWSASGSILENPGFETLNAAGDFPANWGKHWINQGDFRLINSPEEAYRGLSCLKITHDEKASASPFATVGSHRIKAGDKRTFTLKVRARGKGSLGINTYLYGNSNYLSPLKQEDEFFSWLTVDSGEWKDFTVTFSIPARGRIPADGNVFAVDEFEILFSVRQGSICLDEVELYPQGEKPVRQEAFFDVSRTPLITLTRLPESPVMDGELNDPVWKKAAATTGLRTLNDKIAPQQCVLCRIRRQESLFCL